METLAAGDFTDLALSYDACRPGYSDEVIRELLDLFHKPIAEIDFVDIGAGTGIWTRQVSRFLGRSVIAVEPNDAMRKYGESHATSDAINIIWKSGCAEETGLPDHSADLLTMASSFHWVDFQKAIGEFQRVLKPGGWFVAVWNPRVINHPLLETFEKKIFELKPDIKRISSGKSQFVEALSDKLTQQACFTNLHSLEARHKELFDRERYIGVWKSVNDIRAQLGEERFSEFLSYIEAHFPEQHQFQCEYLTRAWAVQKV